MFFNRDYEKIIILYRDPIFRAMSPSNKLKNLVPFKDQKRSEDYFTYDFHKEVIGKLQAWKAWHEKILKIDAKFCLVT